MNKMSNKIPSAGTKADSEQKYENMQVSPAIAKPNVSSSALSYEEQCVLFDEKFGRLDGSTILSHEEYVKHREFLVGSGFFAFLHSQSFDLLTTKTGL